MFLCGLYRAIDKEVFAGEVVLMGQAGDEPWHSDWPVQFTTGSDSKQIPLLSSDLLFWIGYDDTLLLQPSIDMNDYEDFAFFNKTDAYQAVYSMRSKRQVSLPVVVNGQSAILNVPVITFSGTTDYDYVALAAGLVADAGGGVEPFMMGDIGFTNFKWQDLKQIFFFAEDLEAAVTPDFQNRRTSAFFALDDRLEIGEIAVASPIFRTNPISGLIVAASAYNVPAEGGTYVPLANEVLDIDGNEFIPTDYIGDYESALYQSLTDRGYYVVPMGLSTPPPSPVSPVGGLI